MKQKKQIVVLAVLLLILVVVGYFYFDSDKPIVTADVGSVAQNYKLLPVDNLSLHPIGNARKTEYKSSGRNIFSRELPPPPAPRPPRVPKPGDKNYQPPVPIAPPVRTVAGPLPVKFFGYGTVPNGTARLAFFSDAEDVYIVKEGELLMNRFRILKIGNTSLDYEEVSSGLRGTAPLEDQGAGQPTQ